MIRSMTGFGDASGKASGTHYFVEIRSVNNKYLKLTQRLPESLQGLEPMVDAAVRARLGRGSVTVTIKRADTDESAAHVINTAALRRYADQVREVVGGEVDLAALLGLPGVVQPPSDDEARLQHAREAVAPLLELSLNHLVSMREREGLALRDDLLQHHGGIGDRLGKIEALAPGVVAEYERRLKERIDMLLDGSPPAGAEAGDLIREIAIHAEKTDIAEEIARLGEHLSHFEDLLTGEDDRPLGRTLDFLTQEMLREANTIASKSPDAKIARLTVEIKGAIDRIKEQAQNVE